MDYIAEHEALVSAAEDVIENDSLTSELALRIQDALLYLWNKRELEQITNKTVEDDTIFLGNLAVPRSVHLGHLITRSGLTDQDITTLEDELVLIP